MSDHHKKGSITSMFARLFGGGKKEKKDTGPPSPSLAPSHHPSGSSSAGLISAPPPTTTTTTTTTPATLSPPSSPAGNRNSTGNIKPASNGRNSTGVIKPPPPVEIPEQQPSPSPSPKIIVEVTPPSSSEHQRTEPTNNNNNSTPQATPRTPNHHSNSDDEAQPSFLSPTPINKATSATTAHANDDDNTEGPQDENADYKPLPFYEETEKPAPPQSQKPRASGPPEILPEEIEYDPKADFLGQGSFGSVYKGRCRGQEVAVKIPRKQKLTLSELTSFRNEVKIMSKIYHPNVVLFLGACTQMGKMQIVTERCNTDLEKLLASKRPLSLYERMKFAKDAALGMNWLHGITRIVHNDLKSANLLVDANMRVKVTDFGFSQIKEGDQFVDKSKKGTPLWMAPEVMMGQPYDDKADVYSFGIIMWEIVTRDVPYRHHNDYNTFFRAVCYDHERPPLPSDIMPSLKYLITSCWDHDPKNRPTFNEIVFRISEVMVECMIESESARQLWKQYFLLPKQELQEQVPWTDFAACIVQHLGPKPTPSRDVTESPLANIKMLLVTLPRDTIGQVREVVTMERLDKVIKWFGKFYDPAAGPDILAEINSLASKLWFHWDLSRDESTSRLSNKEDGTFLIRLSSTDPKVTPFTLSMTANQHRRIKRVVVNGDQHGGYKLQGKSRVYASLEELVEQCEDYKLRIPCPKVDTSNPYELENFA